MKKFKMLFALAFVMSLGLLFGATKLVYAGVNQCSWAGVGGDNNWSTTANWSCSVGSVPASGYDVIFPISMTGSTIVTVDDLPTTNVYAGVWFTGDSGSSCSGSNGYWIQTGVFRLSGNVTSTVTGTCATYNTLGTDGGSTMFFSAPTTVTSTAAGNVIIGAGTLSLGSNDLTLAAYGWTGVDVQVQTAITGTGNIIVSNNGVNDSSRVIVYATGTPYAANITVTNGYFIATSMTLASSSGMLTVGSSGTLDLDTDRGCNSGGVTTETIHKPITFNSTHSLMTGVACTSGSATENYYTSSQKNVNVVLAGPLTLSTNLSVQVLNTSTSLTGAISGSGHTISLAGGSPGSLVINGSSNNTSTANATISPTVTTTTLADSAPSSTVYIGAANKVVINGTRSNVTVDPGGILGGTGTLGNLTSNGGTITPGLSPGVLNTGNVTYDSSTTHLEELGGTSSGQFDKLNVTGTVNLGSALLSVSLYGGFVPSIGNSFTMINNDSSDAITGTFAGLAEGSSITVSGYKFTISYIGGTGNDVVLTTTYVPGPPGTGFSVLRANVLLPAVITGFGVVMFFAQKRLPRKSFRR